MRQAAPAARPKRVASRDRSAPRRGRMPRGRARGSAVRRFLKALGAKERPARRPGRDPPGSDRPGRRPPVPRASDLPLPTERVAYLECEGLGSFPLDRNGPFRIGRSMRSDLVLPFTSVSRRHAVVEWKGDGFHCHDLLSQNGTFVNGKRVACWRLRLGDRIRIGGVPILFRERERPAPLLEAWQAACVVRERGPSGRVRRATLRGDLSKVRLQEIIPFLELLRRDGVLEVQWDRSSPSGSSKGTAVGRIYFSAGEVIQAKTSASTGTDAFFRLLGLTRGTFLFQEGRTRAARTIRTPATALILEALRRIDEAADGRSSTA